MISTRKLFKLFIQNLLQEVFVIKFALILRYRRKGVMLDNQLLSVVPVVYEIRMPHHWQNQLRCLCHGRTLQILNVELLAGAFHRICVVGLL